MPESNVRPKIGENVSPNLEVQSICGTSKAAVVKIPFLCDVKLCNVVHKHRRFRVTCYTIFIF